MNTLRQKTIYLFFVAGMILLLFARDVIGVSYNKLFLVGFCLLFFVLSPANLIAKMMAFMFPLTWGLPYTYIFIIGIIFYWIKRKRIPSITIILVSLLILLEIVASFWYPTVSYTLMVKYITVVSLFFTFLYDDTIEKDDCILAFYFGTITLSILIIIMTIKSAPSNWLYLFSRGWFRFGSEQITDNEGMMLAVNANTLAYYSVVGLSLAFIYIVESQDRRRWLHIGCLALFVITGVFTVSITWTITASLSVLLFAYVQTKNWKTIIMGAFALLVIGVITFIIISNTPELLEGFKTRFTTIDLTSGHNRTAVMLEYHNYFFNNPRAVFLGTGVTQYRDVTKIQTSFHNMVQQIFVCYGIFGGIAFIAGMFVPFRRLKKHAASLLHWIPLFSVMLFTQTIQFINPESLMLPFVITYYVLKSQTEKVDANEKIYNNG